MSELGGLLWALVIGAPLLILAVWLDARCRCRVEGEPTRSPGEENPGYLTRSEIGDLLAPGIRRPVLRTEPRGERLEIGLADPGFTGMNGRVDLKDTNVLVIDDTGMAMRELMIPISRHQPLVLVARGVDKDVLATLIADRESLTIPLTAIVTDLIPKVADLTGALLMSITDLRAGYLPAGYPGHATHQITDGAHTWIEPHPPLVGTT